MARRHRRHMKRHHCFPVLNIHSGDLVPCTATRARGTCPRPSAAARKVLWRWFAGSLAAPLALLAALPAEAAEADKKITYEQHVQPILREKCFVCHNPNKQSGGLDMTNHTNLMQGGSSGTVIEPGDAEASYLYMLVTHSEEPYMPPESPRLPDAMLNTLRDWINGGALQNAGSKAPAIKKRTVDLASAVPAGQRPSTVAWPPRLSLEPVTHTAQRAAISALATSPWAPLAAVASQKQVLLFHTETAELLGVLPFAEGSVHVLTFSRDGSLLLAGGGRSAASGRVVVWDVPSGERVFEIGDELDVVLAADISPDHSQVALGGPQRVVRVYDSTSGELQYEISDHTNWIHAVKFSPDGVLLATAGRNGMLLLWEAFTGRKFGELKGHAEAVTGIAWRADSNVLASASEDATVRLWGIERGKQIKQWKAHAGGVLSLEYARDGRLASGGRDRVARLWKPNGQQIRAFEAFDELCTTVTICDETDRLIAGDWSGTIRVFDTRDGAAVARLESNPSRLAERLEVAEATLQRLQKDHAAHIDAHKKATAALQEAQSDEEQAQAEKKAKESEMAAIVASAERTRKEASAANASHEASAREAARLQSTLLAVRDAASKAGEASQALAEDTELAQAAEQLEKVAARVGKRLKQEKAMAAGSLAEKQKAESRLVALETQRSAAEAAVVQVRQRCEQAAAKVRAATANLQQVQAAFEASQSAVRAARAAVDRWNEEIEFSSRMSELLAARKTARRQVGESAARHQAALDAVAEAQQAAQASAGRLAERNEELDRIEKEISVARGLDQTAGADATATP